MSDFDEIDYGSESFDDLPDVLEDDIEEIVSEKLKKARKKPHEQKHKIVKIENGVVYFLPSQLKTKTVHTKESKQKLREAMKKRGVSPRTGTSKKPQNLYSQLVEDYKSMNFSVGDAKKLRKWFEENKEDLMKQSNDELREQGIMTTYQHDKFYYGEIYVSEMFYDNAEVNSDKYTLLEDDVIEKIDLEMELNDLEVLWEFHNSKGDSERCLELEAIIERLRKV